MPHALHVPPRRTSARPAGAGPVNGSAARRASEFLEKRLALLQERHGALVARYQKLIDRSRRQFGERVGMFQLGWWGLKATDSGMALVRSGRIVAANERIGQLELCEGRRALWRPAGSQEGRRTSSLPGLRDVIVSETAEVARAGQRGQRVSRFESDAERVIEVRTQRTGNVAPPSFVVLVHDVTALAQAENELESTRRALEQKERLRVMGEIASGVAHDLNNTLNVLMLRLETVMADPACVQAQGASLEVMSRSVEDAVALVRRLQDFARRRHDRPLEALDLAEVVREAMEMTRAELELNPERKQKVTVEAELGTLPPVRGVSAEVRGVIVNLLLNARAAMPEGGTIRLRARQGEGAVSLRVEDEGVGIPPEDLPRVFDPFFTTKGAQGTGLGLSLAYGIMTRLGGAIVAANRAQGGAVFTLTFPLAEGPRPAHGGERPAPLELPRRGGGERVLVVDDDPENTAAVRPLLEEAGLTVETADGGQEAIDLFRAGRRYDLVLCDLGMPRVNGWQVAEGIEETAPGTPVYLVTGWALEIPEADPRRKDIAGVIAKPIRRDQLRAILPPGAAATSTPAPAPAPASDRAVRSRAKADPPPETEPRRARPSGRRSRPLPRAKEPPRRGGSS